MSAIALFEPVDRNTKSGVRSRELMIPSLHHHHHHCRYNPIRLLARDATLARYMLWTCVRSHKPVIHRTSEHNRHAETSQGSDGILRVVFWCKKPVKGSKVNRTFVKAAFTADKLNWTELWVRQLQFGSLQFSWARLLWTRLDADSSLCSRMARVSRESVDKTNKNWLPWQRRLRDQKLTSDWSFTAAVLPTLKIRQRSVP